MCGRGSYRVRRPRKRGRKQTAPRRRPRGSSQISTSASPVGPAPPEPRAVRGPAGTGTASAEPRAAAAEAGDEPSPAPTTRRTEHRIVFPGGRSPPNRPSLPAQTGSPVAVELLRVLEAEEHQLRHDFVEESLPFEDLGEAARTSGAGPRVAFAPDAGSHRGPRLTARRGLRAARCRPRRPRRWLAACKAPGAA